MAVSASKQQFVQNLQQAMNTFHQATSMLKDCDLYYYKNGFNSGGANAIVDSDLTQYNLKAADVAAGMTMAEQLQNFINNAVVAQADYETTVQKLRTT
jgi:hypothetical protein